MMRKAWKWCCRFPGNLFGGKQEFEIEPQKRWSLCSIHAGGFTLTGFAILWTTDSLGD